MNKNFKTFSFLTISIMLFSSMVVLPVPSLAEKPEVSKSPVVILFKEKISDKHKELVNSMGGEITKNFKIINGMAAHLPQQAIEKLKTNPSVIAIDPDIEFHALELDADNRIGASQVWSHSSPATGNGVRVAVLDTGIDTDNPEFAGRILTCSSEMGPSEPTCEDFHGHGTHTAGILGAGGINNDAKGVAYDVSFLIDKVLDKNGSGSLSGIIAGIDWAVANNAKVISMSLGTSPYYDQNSDHCDLWYQSMTNAVNNAFAEGVTVVAAAGNSGASGVGLPACLRNTIAVAAVDDSDTIASFSSIGGAVRHHGISAPGVAIYSSLPGNGYESWSGTSMATPVVAGTAALLLEEDPSLSAYAIKQALFNTACTSTTSPACPSIIDTPNTVYGYGRVNAIAAYESIVGPAPPPASDLDNDGYSISEGDCNDNDDTINPEGIEIADDGIDQNCDGFDKRVIHVHDLDASTSGRKNMNVQITISVFDSTEVTPVAGVSVQGSWSGAENGSSSCVTDSNGQCMVLKSTKGDTLTFTVDTLFMDGDFMTGENHDNDTPSDSDGNSITVNRGGGGNDGGSGGSGGGPDCTNKPNHPKC